MIEKLEYRKWTFDVAERKPGRRTVTVITKEGQIEAREYPAGSRKASSVERTSCSPTEFEGLCREIERCIQQADRLVSYVDDTAEELRIFYPYGRCQRMDRGLGNGCTHVGQIVNAFLIKHGPRSV